MLLVRLRGPQLQLLRSSSTRSILLLLLPPMLSPRIVLSDTKNKKTKPGPEGEPSKLSPMTQAQLAAWAMWFDREKPIKVGERGKASGRTWLGKKGSDEELDVKLLVVEALEECGTQLRCVNELHKLSRRAFDSNGHGFLIFLSRFGSNFADVGRI